MKERIRGFNERKFQWREKRVRSCSANQRFEGEKSAIWVQRRRETIKWSIPEAEAKSSSDTAERRRDLTGGSRRGNESRVRKKRVRVKRE